MVSLFQVGFREMKCVAGAGKEHPQRRLQILFLGALQMLHYKDAKLLREFVLAGGLVQLTSLLVTENPFLRSQAVSIFMAITSSSDLDWYDITYTAYPSSCRCLEE